MLVFTLTCDLHWAIYSLSIRLIRQSAASPSWWGMRQVSMAQLFTIMFTHMSNRFTCLWAEGRNRSTLEKPMIACETWKMETAQVQSYCRVIHVYTLQTDACGYLTITLSVFKKESIHLDWAHSATWAVMRPGTVERGPLGYSQYSRFSSFRTFWSSVCAQRHCRAGTGFTGTGRTTKWWRVSIIIINFTATQGLCVVVWWLTPSAGKSTSAAQTHAC